MKLPVKTIVGIAVVGALFATNRAYWGGGKVAPFRQEKVSKGHIVAAVNSTGTVQPVLTVPVGSSVSGPVTELLVDFNSVVKKDELLAKIDPQLYESAVERDRALLGTHQAALERAKAELQRAENDEARALALKQENVNYISAAELDQFKFARIGLAAQVKVAEATVRQAEASLKSSETNLAYTEIRSPVEGVIINRKIDRGQTVIVQMQGQEMFTVAPDMRKKIYVQANVDEADIGLIREAQKKDLPVRFTVDASPTDVFHGHIFQVRMNPTTLQNVVTYPVVVECANEELKLLPGMTPSLSFQVDDVQNVLRIPNAALRFVPQRDQVRPEDKHILDGVSRGGDKEEEENASKTKLTAEEKAAVRRKRTHRFVWVVEGDKLKAISVVTGLSDNQYTQLVSGDVAEGQALVIGQPVQE